MTDSLATLQRCLLALLSLLLPSYGWSQETSADRGIAAYVDEVPILISGLQQQFDSLVGERTLTAEQKKRLQNEILNRVIQRQLVQAYLQRVGQGASNDDLQLAREQFARQLKLKKQTLEEYLTKEKIDQAELDSRLRWQLSWDRFQRQYLTDANLERYFNQNRQQFDGTKRRISQILLRTSAATSPQELKELQQRQQQLREQITTGKVAFADAARKYSESPTAAKGGDIGMIGWSGPMPAHFTKVAFQLKVGGTSQPLVTRFGVHLIHCTEVKPGTGRWQDVREPLKAAVVQYLFKWASDQQTEHSEVRRTGNWPLPQRPSE